MTNKIFKCCCHDIQVERKFVINYVAALACALLLFHFLASQKAQNGGGIWKRNETTLNQK